MHNWSKDVLVVDLPREPHIVNELENLLEVACNKGNADVLLDFKTIDVITSASLSKLLKLRKLFIDNCRRLILCNVNPVTMEIFISTGLDGVFEFVGDMSVAFPGLQNTYRPPK